MQFIFLSISGYNGLLLKKKLCLNEKHQIYRKLSNMHFFHITIPFSVIGVGCLFDNCKNLLCRSSYVKKPVFKNEELKVTHEMEGSNFRFLILCISGKRAVEGCEILFLRLPSIIICHRWVKLVWNFGLPSHLRRG